MYIEAVPNRSSPPAILLRESCRDAGKVRKRTLANLSTWPPTLVEGLRVLLKGGTAVPRLDAAFDVIRSLPHGHVAAVLGTPRQLRLDRLLDPEPSPQRAGAGNGRRAHPRPRLEAGDRPRAGRGHRAGYAGRDPAPRTGGRG